MAATRMLWSYLVFRMLATAKDPLHLRGMWNLSWRWILTSLQISLTAFYVLWKLHTWQHWEFLCLFMVTS